MIVKPDIDLSDHELELLNRIAFESQNQNDIRASIMPMMALSQLLFKRNAVPEIRLLYFTDPERNPGGRGKSREQEFESNGTAGEEIFAHPNFMRYLRYYIFGPAVPADAKKIFKEKSVMSGYLTAGDITELLPEARRIVRQYALNPSDASEEFYKLALECGASPRNAASIIQSVRAVNLV